MDSVYDLYKIEYDKVKSKESKHKFEEIWNINESVYCSSKSFHDFISSSTFSAESLGTDRKASH